ncbi:ABC transporter substrate-binding protein [Alkaliphilus peptidifermentans]|uniref:Iron(III) transport system substrate-binding protein n=1 Tax=Alkaliphilus peptidifermentans DSM 18978 TaxID=1120976 RepID=A0A1G5AVG6_9FIRM|nr:ABC transporter substrate-binding protein [Alkaliphilus peptidifermentans]SCX81887.1 iron(III) transport system substrate-binding protein [Alkaliphilus peptidifermentans DSM 18978]
MNYKKIIAIVLSVLLIGGLLVGCSSDNEVGQQTPEENDTQQENSTEQKASGSVTVYSPHSAEVINPIVKEFQERTGVQVDVVAAGTGELLKRIEAESANPLGDVMWGGGAESLDSFKDYFEPYKTQEDNMIAPYFKDAEYNWTGFSALPMVIMYNKKLVKPEDVPTSWEDLLDDKWKGKIAYADPARSGSSYTTLVTILKAFENDGDDGWNFIRSFIDNLDGKIIGSSSGVFVGVADGEYSIGLTLEEAAMRYVVAGADVGVVYPSEGTSAVPDGIAVIKDAKNMENAKLFIDFVVGKDVQNIVVNNFSRRSIRSDLEAPEGLDPIDKIKLVDYDFSWAANNKDEVLDKWRNIVIGRE